MIGTDIIKYFQINHIIINALLRKKISIFISDNFVVDGFTNCYIKPYSIIL